MTDDFKILHCFQFRAVRDAVCFNKSTADKSVEDSRTNSLQYSKSAQSDRKAKTRAGEENDDTGIQKRKDFRADRLAKTKAARGSGEAAAAQGVRCEGSERKCQILLTPSACCLLAETIERRSVLNWINYYSLLTYTCSHLGLEIAFIYLQHAQGHHVVALRLQVSARLVSPTVIQSHHLCTCLKLKNLVTS